MTHFNGMGSYLRKIENAKKKRPIVAAEYESVLEEVMQKERLANDAWGLFPETEEAYNSKREYLKENVAPLEVKLVTLWGQLFSKDEHEIDERREMRESLQP